MLEFRKSHNATGKENNTIHNYIDDKKTISILFFDGQNKDVVAKDAKEKDPRGFVTECLLNMNLTRNLHKFDDAEIRVAVAAALCLGMFGFTDSALADKILSFVDVESYSVGIHRVFQMSVDFSYHELAQYMISWGANPNALFEDDQREPLRTAKKNSDDKMVKILIENGAKTDA